MMNSPVELLAFDEASGRWFELSHWLDMKLNVVPAAASLGRGG